MPQKYFYPLYLFIMNTNLEKEKEYLLIEQQLEALISNESDRIANLANACALLKETKGYFWVGFYLLDQNQLILGPFQGPVACTRIELSKGVCGHAFTHRQTTNVPNVHEFEGHIACSALSNSELVVPLIKQDKCLGVLDIDSLEFNAFDQQDSYHLERIVECIVKYCF